MASPLRLEHNGLDQDRVLNMRATRRMPMQKELQSWHRKFDPFVIRDTRVAATCSSNIDVATLVWAPFLCSNVHGIHDWLLGCLLKEKLSAILNDINLDERNAPYNLCAAG
ncbi:hypothetical protein V6N13_102504 [Hibiscus sabdariffa]|uniref:Uncharacterized protein n=2 Tax=Hibiscus sabdariffa TaxID=183260 RepID=A0ABR2D514_9ROSI